MSEDQVVSVFDPNLFLDAQTTESNEKRATIPTENPDEEDGLYMAVIGEIKTDSGKIGQGDRTGDPWISMIIPLKLQFGAELQALELPAEFQITDRVFLDLTADGKGLDNSKGKNRGQRMYREATGLNVPGEAFAWRMLEGRVVKVKLVHDLYTPPGEGETRLVEKVGQILPG